ncbi:Glutamate receptor 2 [Portunus trituberculatus]|uniref:Glutamate receptor 2 n=1 Tax=Portunus trituberculatus TaxID=210409 RepID=A0A5B7GNJ1_PORTR|nr:Glutamate receptor 2 [Portunus trituberculatus]
MIGMVHRNEVEMALGPFSVTAQREEDIDFSMAVLRDNQAIITARPTLWALVLASMVAMAGSVVGVVAGEGRIFGETPKNIVAKTCLCVLSTLMQDGSEWVPPHDAGRVLLTTWLLASMVFMSSYEGILVAMLTFPRVSIPIDSLTELDSDYEVWQKAFHGMSGTIPNCWSARKDLIRGKFAAVCYEMTMMKTISWDFR